MAELDSYRHELESMMGVDSSPYEKSVAFLLDSDGLLPRNDPDFLQRWPKRPRPSDLNIAEVLGGEIAAHPNIDIWLGATASRFQFDPITDRLTSIASIDHYGHSLTVTADEFVIAAGALESTRLMLIADRQSGGVVSRVSDVLGRHFNDHFGINVATVRPRDRGQTIRALSDRWTLGGNRHLHLELSPDAQKEGRVASAYCDFGVTLPDTSALAQIGVAAEGVKSRRFAVALRSARHVPSGLPDLAKVVVWRYGHKKRYWPTDARIELKVWIEQLPRWGNRLLLSDVSDSLGQPRLRCELEKTDDEERTLRFTVNKIRAFWARHLSALGTLDWIPEVDDPGVRLVDLAVQLAHPAGTTRMGIDPATSVVDTSLRVHAVPNLTIVSSSVFPTSGSANPTLTIMQLAMRAAGAITSRLQSPNVAYEATPGG